MFQKIYRITTVAIILAISVALLTACWSAICTRTAVRLYYGKKSVWNNFYIISNIQENTIVTDLISDSVYDVVDEPINVFVLTPQDCFMNKCEPDIIVSDKLDFMKRVSVDYRFSSVSNSTKNYVSVLGGVVDDKKNIVWLQIWNKKIYFSISSKGKNSKVAMNLIKSIAADKILKRMMSVDFQMREQKIRKEKARKKIEKMREKATTYDRVKRSAGFF